VWMRFGGKCTATLNWVTLHGLLLESCILFTRCSLLSQAGCQQGALQAAAAQLNAHY
jgi:hypothetical protein